MTIHIAAQGQVRPYPAFVWSAESQQFFDRLLNPPGDARAAYSAALIDALVAGGVGDKLDALYVVGENEAIYLTNLVQAAYQATVRDGFAGFHFDPDIGFRGTAACFADSNFNPSTDSGNFTQDDACLFGWSLVSAIDTEPFICTSDDETSGESELYARYTGDVSPFMLNSAAPSSVASTDGSGLRLLNRTSASALALYRNDALVVSATNTSASPADLTLKFAVGSVQTIAAFGFGASLSSGERTALYNALHAYLTATGAI